MKIIFVAGGSGFLGSSFIKYFIRRNKDFIVVNLDKHTHGYNENLKELDASPRYHFIKGNICNQELVSYIMKRFKPDYIINFASETSPDRCSQQPQAATETNILGTINLLDNARYIWNKKETSHKFIQISTDEVYGDSINEFIDEEAYVFPKDPYAATKASADLLVDTFNKSFNLPTVIARCCNTYGPYQPETQFIPSLILHALDNSEVEISECPKASREWMYVLDNSVAVTKLIFYGKPGEIYNIGSGQEISNEKISNTILDLLEKPKELVRFTQTDDSFHTRTVLNSYKASANLNWSAKINYIDGVKETIRWFAKNRS